MSTRYSPKLITDGLVLSVDAANKSSYPNTGTVWYDLSGNTNNLDLIGSPTYSNGYFTLNGTSQYAQLVNAAGFFNYNTNNLYSDVGYAFSVCAWFNFPVSPNGIRTGNQSFAICGESGGIGGAETLTLYVGSATDTSLSPSIPYYCTVGMRGSKTVISPTSVNTGTWNNVVVTWNGTAGRAYFNSVDRGATNIGTAGIQTTYYFSIGVTGNVLGTLGNVPQYFEGKLANVSVYNRALTATEVLQNYNANKTRFGLI